MLMTDLHPTETINAHFDWQLSLAFCRRGNNSHGFCLLSCLRMNSNPFNNCNYMCNCQGQLFATLDLIILWKMLLTSSNNQYVYDYHRLLSSFSYGPYFYNYLDIWNAGLSEN